MATLKRALVNFFKARRELKAEVLSFPTVYGMSMEVSNYLNGVISTPWPDIRE